MIEYFDILDEQGHKTGKTGSFEPVFVCYKVNVRLFGLFSLFKDTDHFTG